MFFLPALALTALAIFCVLFPLSRQLAYEGRPLRADSKRRRLVALTALLFIPLFSYGVYSKLGQPNLSDMPLQQRVDASLDDADFSTLISRLEQHLQQDKKDTRGWLILARSYRSAGRFDDSVRAYREILALNKDDVPALLGLADVLSQIEGRVTPEAKTLSEAVLKQSPTQPQARYFLGKAKLEAGDRQGGLRDLKALLKDTPEGTPGHDIIVQEIKSHE